MDWLRRHHVMWDFETDMVLINGVEVDLVAHKTPNELDVGIPSVNGRCAEPLRRQASQQPKDAALCAVDSSSLGGRQSPCAEAKETEQFFAIARKAIDRVKRQRGGRGRPRAGMRQQGCFHCHEGGHQVRHCPYDPQRRGTDRAADECETTALSEREFGGRKSPSPGADSRGRRQGCYRCGGKHLMRNCPDRGGGASPVPRIGALNDGRLMSASAEGAPTTESAIRRWGALRQGNNAGLDRSQEVVGEQVPWGWEDGQGHP